MSFPKDAIEANQTASSGILQVQKALEALNIEVYNLRSQREMLLAALRPFVELGRAINESDVRYAVSVMKMVEKQG